MEEEPIKFLANRNCKTCFGRGFVTRTTPSGKGNKEMYRHKTLCHCATEIKTPEPDECVVPKVAKNFDALGDIHMEPEGTVGIKPMKQYASIAQPLH